MNIVENSPDALQAPETNEDPLPIPQGSDILPSLYKLLVWIRDTRPDLFYTIVSPVKGHKLIPPEE